MCETGAFTQEGNAVHFLYSAQSYTQSRENNIVRADIYESIALEADFSIERR